jgi:S-adenosylmethionine hydrolase
MSLITLTTDFGYGSPYAAAMKGVILSIDPAAAIVDLTHGVPPQDIAAGPLALDDAARWFPPGTIHVAVVDPGVGTGRAMIYAEIGGHRYLAPDNGLLSLVAARSPPSKLIQLTNPEFWLPQVSATFHGRDILAPVAARLGLGLAPERLGPPLSGPRMLALPSVRVAADRLEGVVQAIDSFGNLITNLTADLLAGRPTDQRARVACGGHETWGIFHTYADKENGMLIALVGSTGRLELAIVGGNAAQRFGIAPGAPVAVTWE